MVTRPRLPDVGAMDPELRNSPIVDELDDEEAETVRLQVPGDSVCYFNGQPFAHGEAVISGTQILRCHHGIWVDGGPADPTNP